MYAVRSWQKERKRMYVCFVVAKIRIRHFCVAKHMLKNTSNSSEKRKRLTDTTEVERLKHTRLKLDKYKHNKFKASKIQNKRNTPRQEGKAIGKSKYVRTYVHSVGYAARRYKYTRSSYGKIIYKRTRSGRKGIVEKRRSV